MSAVSTVSAGGRAEGFPAIPKLVDRGRELAASLRGMLVMLSRACDVDAVVDVVVLSAFANDERLVVSGLRRCMH